MDIYLKFKNNKRKSRIWLFIKEEKNKDYYNCDGGGGTASCGLTPTEDVSWLLEEVTLAKHSLPSFFSTV